MINRIGKIGIVYIGTRSLMSNLPNRHSATFQFLSGTCYLLAHLQMLPYLPTFAAKYQSSTRMTSISQPHRVLIPHIISVIYMSCGKINLVFLYWNTTTCDKGCDNRLVFSELVFLSNLLLYLTFYSVLICIHCTRHLMECILFLSSEQ